MKNVLLVLLGFGLCAGLAVALFFPGHGPAIFSFAAPSAAGLAVKAALEEELAEQARDYRPVPNGEAMIQALSPADLEALSVIAAQEDAAWKASGTNPNPPLPDLDPAIKTLSPAAIVTLALLVAHEGRIGRKAQAVARQNAPAIDLSGRPPPPSDQVTPAEQAEYRQQIATNTFQLPIRPSHRLHVLQSPDIDQTEDNWLARLIVQDIAGQVIVGLHLKQPVDDLHVHVDVDSTASNAKIYVHFLHWIDDPAVISGKLDEALPIEFAWDPLGYSVLVEYLCGKAPLPAAAPDPDAAGLLEKLLDLNGPLLAREDLRVSALLQNNSLDPSAQGEAALLLVAMAWRENADEFSDNRRLLCKAAAHLALAFGVDSLNRQPPDWNARVADAALRTLSGRETDALQHIDQLAAQADVPAAARIWLAALRLWSTHDYRTAKIDASSPMLVKIGWFQVLCDDLDDLNATEQLDQTGPLANVPDWGRALMNIHNGISVDNGNRFAQATLDLELKEASEVAKVEKQPLADDKALEAGLASPGDETVTVDTTGHATLRVIGPGTFLAASSRHILNSVGKTDKWLRHSLDLPEEAGQFEARVTSWFQNVPHFLLVAYSFPHADGSSHSDIDVILREKSAVWDVTDLPPTPLFSAFLGDAADLRVLNDFYVAGEPCGTVYDFPYRRQLFSMLHIDPQWHAAPDAQPPSKAYQAFRAYFEQLQQLNPDSWALADAIIESDHGIRSGDTAEQAFDALKHFMDYSTHPFNVLISAHSPYKFTDAQLQSIYAKQAKLDPGVYFLLGDLLRKDGLVDDAAKADRQGADRARDPLLVAASDKPLIDYYLAHGKTDEALTLAKRGADVYSGAGIQIYALVLEKLNRLDEAETWYKNLKERYGDDEPLIELYLAHPDHFLTQVTALKKTVFPKGTITVDLNSFSAPPENGAVFISYSPTLTNAGLEQGDVVVALNSTKIESLAQYYYVRSGIIGNAMDLIIWDKSQYKEIHASPPERLFQVEMKDYPIR